MEKFYRLKLDGFEFTKEPLIRMVVEKDEISTTKNVYFTMTVLSKYSRQLYKTEEEYENQTRRPEALYHARLLTIDYKDGDKDQSLDSEGLNGLPRETAETIINTMKEYSK